jgi:hypothetical protein
MDDLACFVELESRAIPDQPLLALNEIAEVGAVRRD